MRGMMLNDLLLLDLKAPNKLPQISDWLLLQRSFFTDNSKTFSTCLENLLKIHSSIYNLHYSITIVKNKVRNITSEFLRQNKASLSFQIFRTRGSSDFT